MTSIKAALDNARIRLEKTSPSARIDAELLLAHTLNTSRSFLYAHGTDPLDDETLDAYEQDLSKRLHGMPIAYIVGTREFWSLPLRVTEDTLIPRPETELLVDLTLSLLQNQDHASVLDLGTGSGAVALALASARPHWTILACDISPSALCMAQENARLLQLQNVTFMLSNWFESVPTQQVHAIVSNPPYLAENDAHLSQGDVRFEPKSALTSGPDGLDALSHLIQNSQPYLHPGGLLLLEHGYLQAEAVAERLQASNYQSIQCWLDLQGHPRVSGGFSKQESTSRIV